MAIPVNNDFKACFCDGSCYTNVDGKCGRHSSWERPPPKPMSEADKLRVLSKLNSKTSEKATKEVYKSLLKQMEEVAKRGECKFTYWHRRDDVDIDMLTLLLAKEGFKVNKSKHYEDICLIIEW